MTRLNRVQESVRGTQIEPDQYPPRTGGSPMIEVDSVRVQLGEVTALDRVSFTVARGTFLGLIGPNGAGKTTLLRTITAALTPDIGVVRVAGDDVSSLNSKEVSQRVAALPQESSIAFDFTVQDVVAMGRTPYLSRFGRTRAADRDAVRWAMDLTEVTRFADRMISELSGGERQRVMLARAVAQETPVLLLDEPTASLDINHQVQTLELVKDLVQAGKTVIAAIHDLNLAAHYCDNLMLLSAGRKLSIGSPADVLTETNLETAFDTTAVVSRHPVTGAVYVTALPDRPGSDTRGQIHVIGGGGSAARLVYLLTSAGYEVSIGALNQGDADLETARTLGLTTVTVDPYAPVSDAAYQGVVDLVNQADATVIADIEVGTGNLPNLEAAIHSDTIIVVEDRPFQDRNFAGDEAAELYSALCNDALVVNPGGLLQAVITQLEG